MPHGVNLGKCVVYETTMKAFAIVDTAERKDRMSHTIWSTAAKRGGCRRRVVASGARSGAGCSRAFEATVLQIADLPTTVRQLIVSGQEVPQMVARLFVEIPVRIIALFGSPLRPIPWTTDRMGWLRNRYRGVSYSSAFG